VNSLTGLSSSSLPVRRDAEMQENQDMTTRFAGAHASPEYRHAGLGLVFSPLVVANIAAIFDSSVKKEASN
jgi:hypothetical protein